ncbi:MAG TPA: hypothetical protein VN380_08795 [Thermoanaerobaculia bacterium]|jgi:hypothetical protein|nr:hypothetical protein [Thermoanaerobaculia bacterium]
MTTNSLRALQHQLSSQAVHIDFLRLRCGSEKTFLRGIRAVREAETSDPIHPFIAFSEWDALIVVPCSQLYPPTLTDVYSNPDVAASVSGTSGYFAYLWNHDVNKHWQETLAVLAKSGPTILMSLRFADWFRQDVGLGGEILFCNRITEILGKAPDVRAIVAHSLGWNDVMLLVHARKDTAQLIGLLKDIRLMTLADCIGGREDLRFSQTLNTQIFAASYSHLLGGLEGYVENRLSFGSLSRKIDSARLLIRVAPPHEQDVRAFMQEQTKQIGADVVDSEMGHYSLSIDMSDIVAARGGEEVIRFIAATREYIGGLGDHRPDSYAETTSIFRFVEKGLDTRTTFHPAAPDVKKDIKSVEKLLQTVPHLMRERGASSMTSHRFISALTTLLDHLFDPVRSSVVRHLSRFAATIPNRIRELNLDGIDDLCHVLEYAIGQAIDGIGQFQHDANALGLSGRGGYSRLIVAVDWYIRSALIGLGMYTELPLITFGLRTGNAGSTGRYQIDIPFNVLFVPSRWQIILHEIGHLAWIHAFGWMMESLAIYSAMEKEIPIEIRRQIRKGTKLRDALRKNPKEQVQVEFLRVRELVRELFPSYLMFALPCAGNIEEYDEFALRPMVMASHSSSLSRDLLLRVVTHCLLEIMQDALDKNTQARTARRAADLAAAALESDPVKREAAENAAAENAAAERAATWWRIWKDLMNESEKAAVARVDDAAASIHDTLLRIDRESRVLDTRRQLRRESDSRRSARLKPNLAATMHILHSDTFKHAVREALHSVIMVLTLRGKLFQKTDPEHIGPRQFGMLLDKIDAARHVETDADYDLWLGRPFAEWLSAGEVLTRHREAFDWSRLLLGSREQLLQGDRSAFMRAQLSVLLSMWHDATTEDHRGYEELDDILLKLGVARTMEPTVVPPRRKAASRRPRRSKVSS